MSRPDPRLVRLLGDGAAAFRTAFDLVPDPLGVLWAIRDADGAIADFETGYSNPAMARMIGVPLEVSMGRRLLEEAPEFRDDDAFKRMLRVLETSEPDVVEVAVTKRQGPIGRVAGRLPAPGDPLRGRRSSQPRDRCHPSSAGWRRSYATT
jgi:PAS domain-containing protein